MTTLKDVREKVHADSYHLKDGVFTLRWGFFYTHGMTADDKVAFVEKMFPGAVVLEAGEVWKPFRGGAKVAASSHWFVKFTVPSTGTGVVDAPASDFPGGTLDEWGAWSASLPADKKEGA